MKLVTDPGKSFSLTYHFEAPRKRVYNAFANADALNEWWGPVECKNSVVKLDFREGGIFHYKMEAGGNVNYGRFVFKTIKPHELLEFTNAFADERGNIVPAPFNIKLPIQIFYSLRFIEHEGITTIELTGTPVNATEEEQQVFTSINASMIQGFGGTFEKLKTYLNKGL